MKTLVFQGGFCYNEDTKNAADMTTSNTEMVTISRAEYESLKVERDELNQKLDWLMEQMRLAKKKVYRASSGKTFILHMPARTASRQGRKHLSGKPKKSLP